jgi:hypothetical protein
LAAGGLDRVVAGVLLESACSTSSVYTLAFDLSGVCNLILLNDRAAAGSDPDPASTTIGAAGAKYRPASGVDRDAAAAFFRS